MTSTQSFKLWLRTFKRYRESKGGKWWKVRSYDIPFVKGEPNYLWLHESDNFSWPENDGLFMDDIEWFRFKGEYGEGIGFYSNGCMENTPTEDYTKWVIPEIPEKVEELKQSTIVLENNSKLKFLKTSSHNSKLISILKKEKS